MIIRDYTNFTFPEGSLADFIEILQEIQRLHPEATVCWATGGPGESDSMLIRRAYEGKWSNDGGMKTYTREELEKLATESPQGLALLFAQKVAGYPDALWANGLSRRFGRPPEDLTLVPFVSLPNYLLDWTSVINVAEARKLIWQMVHSRNSGRIFQCFKSFDGPETHCHQQPNWPDCAALMIVMIEVMQK